MTTNIHATHIPKVNWKEDIKTGKQEFGCLHCHPSDPPPERVYFLGGTSLCYTHAHAYGAPDDN